MILLGFAKLLKFDGCPINTEDLNRVNNKAGIWYTMYNNKL